MNRSLTARFISSWSSNTLRPACSSVRTTRSLHVSEHAGRYCVLPGGELTSNAIKLVRQELRIELRAALHFVREKSEPIATKPIHVRFNGESGSVVLHVRPASTAHHQGYALVIFDEQPAEATAEKALGLPARPTEVPA